MKILKGKLRLYVLCFIVFIIGCFAGLVTSSYLYYRYVFSKTIDRRAIELGWQIDVVCQLRLGEIDASITQLEYMIDENTVAVALTPNIPKTDIRDHVLRGIKTYREIYPSQTQFASMINDALIDIRRIETFKSDARPDVPKTCWGFTESLGRLVKHTESQKDR